MPGRNGRFAQGPTKVANGGNFFLQCGPIVLLIDCRPDSLNLIDDERGRCDGLPKRVTVVAGRGVGGQVLAELTCGFATAIAVAEKHLVRAYVVVAHMAFG